MAMPDNAAEDDDYEGGECPDDYDDECEEEVALNEAYFASVMDQYLRLRSILHADLPSNAVSRVVKARLKTDAPAENQSAAIATWSRLLRETDPHPLQVALMSKDTTLRILRILLGGKFLRQGYTLPERTSRWIWALLARMPDKGELNHTEIGWIRDLGRRAVLLGRSLAEMAALREELAEGGLGAHEAVDGSSSDEEVLADPDDVEVEGAISSGQDEDEPTPLAESRKEVEKPPKVTEPTRESPPKPDAEEGEIEDEDEDEDVAMEIATDSEAEEGEVTAQEPQENLEAARERLLARISNGMTSEDEEDLEKESAKHQLRANLRATLNMILTIAGEFYGQRDLLEFREPFIGM
jgi:hypothetical protein